MTKLLKKTKAQRKTFTIPSYIVEELEAYSSSHHQKQSQVIALALEEFLHNKNNTDKNKARLKALDSLIGIAKDGSLTDIDLKALRVKRALNDA